MHAQPSTRFNRASDTSALTTPWNTSVSDPVARHSSDYSRVEQSSDVQTAEATMHGGADLAVESMLATHQVLPPRLLCLPAVMCEAQIQ